ncbi:hypothetical protein ACVBEF_21235, partial [Glaciimonas sp. GG7]
VNGHFKSNGNCGCACKVKNNFNINRPDSVTDYCTAEHSLFWQLKNRIKTVIAQNRHLPVDLCFLREYLVIRSSHRNTGVKPC